MHTHELEIGSIQLEETLNLDLDEAEYIHAWPLHPVGNGAAICGATDPVHTECYGKFKYGYPTWIQVIANGWKCPSCGRSFCPTCELYVRQDMDVL